MDDFFLSLNIIIFPFISSIMGVITSFHSLNKNLEDKVPYLLTVPPFYTMSFVSCHVLYTDEATGLSGVISRSGSHTLSVLWHALGNC